MHLKRFLLFGYYDNYPSGGANDFCGSYDTIEECKNEIDSWKRYFENSHVLDITNGNVTKIEQKPEFS